MKKKVLSAIVVLCIFIPLIILGGIYFRIAITLLSVLALKEFLDLSKNKKRPIYVDIILYALVMAITYLTSDLNKYYYLSFLLPFLAVIYCNDNERYNADDAFKYIAMTLLIGIVFHNAIQIRNTSMWLCIYLLLIPILTDTYAQLGGMLIGKHKFAPKISPNKTWEGTITGAVFGTLGASVFYYIAISPDVDVFGLLIITLFLSCLGQIGDLFFSAIKRNHNVKDFSKLIPGHGGVLDRLDSIIFVIIGYILLKGII